MNNDKNYNEKKLEKHIEKIQSVLDKKNKDYTTIASKKPNLKTDTDVEVVDWISKLLKQYI